MSSAVKVAFATTDMEHVDDHFGSAETFAIWQVGEDEARCVGDARMASDATRPNEAKLPAKIATLEGCVAVYCAAIGPSAVQQLLRSGVRPVPITEGEAIASLVVTLQEELRSGAPWLARALGPRPGEADRFAVMESEGWEE
jgi:nitrogen fixation protein NifX